MKRRTALKAMSLGAPLLAAGAAAFGFSAYRSAMREAEDAWRKIESEAERPAQRFDHAMISGLPEIGQRYFKFAIAPGTPLMTTVRLEMRGTFLLGDKDSHQTYSMRARQILRPPSQFVWIPDLRSGIVRISGSDALVAGKAWTRFWMAGMVPVARSRTSPDLVRSAIFRSTMEGVWAPASLLPQQGVAWEQTGPDKARVRVQSVEPEIVLEMTLAPSGAIEEIVGQRWTNANPEQQFRLQPFGGTIEGNATFQGYTIPSRLKVGNHFGKDDYLPFFQAEITSATYVGASGPRP
jgi:hypothetical protein